MKNKSSIGSLEHDRYGVQKQTGQSGRLAGAMRIVAGDTKAQAKQKAKSQQEKGKERKAEFAREKRRFVKGRTTEKKRQGEFKRGREKEGRGVFLCEDV